MKKGDDYVTRMNLYNLIFRMVILLYGINKMGTNGDGGVVVCGAATIASNFGPGLKSQPGCKSFFH
jgi:hypothetical protein